MCQNIKRYRSGLSHQTIKEYFNELGESLEGFEPQAIVNYNKSNLTDNPSVKKNM